MYLSFVILSYNSSQHLETCIRSVLDDGVDRDATEVWVVDNGSTDGSVEILARLQSQYPGTLNVILLDHNHGTTASRNLALRRTTGRYVVVMDSDVRLSAGLVAGLISRLEEYPRCGIIAPRLIYPDGRRQLSVDVFPTLGHKLRRLVSLDAMTRSARRGDSDILRSVDYAISALWLMKRSILDAVGLLDERIFYSPEDVDFCLRVWKAGFVVLYEPAFQAVHAAQEVSRSFPPSRFAVSHALGLLYLFRKHRYMFSRRRLYREIGRRTA